MADQQMRPASPQQAPDPSMNYERSHPDRESPSGGLDQPKTDKPRQHDRQIDAVPNRQDGSQEISGDEGAHGKTHAAERGKQVTDLPIPNSVAPAAAQPDHSMKDEEPTGWDQAPQGKTPAEQSRHPRIGGKGGTPDVGESPRKS